ncbi:MAG: DUF2141 domain-containing protein [Flavobacteriaceae bacterium]|nr:DUF2141 domain-containing protein [Flavobacteriaceae bacterium]
MLRGHTSKVSFRNVAAGSYAIISYHDENNNKQLDFSPKGMPLEDYGTSNNPLNFEPPDFESTSFDLLMENLKLKIRF